MRCDKNTEAVIKTAEKLLITVVFQNLPFPNHYKKIIAFTLAEVLITLMIIGIIASLTIPAIIINTNEAEYNVGVKKALSDLSNAADMIQVNGGTVSYAGDTELRADFCNVMKCIKKGTASSLYNSLVYKYYKSNEILAVMNDSVDRYAALANGNMLQFFAYGGCGAHGVNACGDIWIDINGLKGPNMVGKDLYNFYLVKDEDVYSIAPAGTQGDTYNPASTCVAGDGFGCTAVRLSNPDSLR